MNTASIEKNEECTEVYNSLLRGELSALETYSQAIAKFAGDKACKDLTHIRDEHQRSVSALQSEILEMGGEPETAAGSWGLFAKAVQAGANLLGEESALESLKSGEEHGRREYEDALSDPNVSPSCKDMIREQILPRIHSHIETLDRLGA